jgi:hypothetical protein
VLVAVADVRVVRGVMKIVVKAEVVRDTGAVPEIASAWVLLLMAPNGVKGL